MSKLEQRHSRKGVPLSTMHDITRRGHAPPYHVEMRMTQQGGAYPSLSHQIWNQDMMRRAHTLLTMSKHDGENTHPSLSHRKSNDTVRRGYALLARVRQEQHEEGCTPLIMCHGSVCFI